MSTPHWIRQFYHFLFSRASYLQPEELIEGLSVISENLKDELLHYASNQGLMIDEQDTGFLIHRGRSEIEGVRIDYHFGSDKAFSLKLYVEKEYALAPKSAQKIKPF